LESNYNTAKKLEEKPEPFKETLKLRMKDNDKTISRLLSEMSETAFKWQKTRRTIKVWN